LYLSKMSFRHLLISFLLFPLIMSITFNGCSQTKTTPSAFIASFEGDVQMKKAGTTNWIKAEVKATLEASDSIKTGTDSKISITFFDGSTIEMTSNAQIEIKELIKGKTTSIRLKQDIGETLSKVKNLADTASRYEIETPAAIAGVRGSQMRVTVAPDGTTVVQNVEGKISVTAQGQEVLIPEGNSSTVEPGQTPSAPAPSAPTPSNVHINSDSKGDLFDINGRPVIGYQYLDIVNEWIERKTDTWSVTIELDAKYPDTLDPEGIVEWNVMVDADNDINTGWKSPLLFNDLGIDYYLSLSRTGVNFSLNAQRIIDSSTTYPHYMKYHIVGNTITIEFNPETIGNSNKFSFIVLARQYAKKGDSQSLIAADKIPGIQHFMISLASP
jgi:hypothetical protein